MLIVSEQYSKLVGVDTHAATHTLAVVDAVTGAELGQHTFPATAAGMNRAVQWATRRAGQVPTLFVIEGIGSYGAGLARLVGGRGFDLVEPSQMSKAQLRGRGKSDLLDATRIARSVQGVAVSMLRRPRAEGIREALRVLVVAREEMAAENTRASNALTALMRTFDVGIDARRPLTGPQIATIARWRGRAGEPVALATARTEAIRLASRVVAVQHELADNRTAIDGLVAQQAPQLLDMVGVGPVVAATVLVAWSHPGRVRSEAALASLAGTCPVPASSGNTVRHRLNRGGDRRLNRVITTVALVRMRCDQGTRAYVEKRTAQGLSKKEIMRCLKRYITRQLFRALAPKAVALPA